jgi:hypothetical protein
MNPAANTPVPAIVAQMAAQMEAKLRAMKASFKIILPDGTEFGDLEVVVKKKSKRQPRDPLVPRGAYAAVYKPILLSMQPGDVQVFDPHPYGFNVEWYAAAVSAGAVNLWGGWLRAIYHKRQNWVHRVNPHKIRSLTCTL